MSKADTTTALRHLVFSELLSLLPRASSLQTETFICNLSLQRAIGDKHPMMTKDFKRATDRLIVRFADLRVSFDLNKVKMPFQLSKMTIETELAKRYGDRLKHVPGFYFKNRWRVNLPDGCALHGYRYRNAYIGILCQPLHQIDSYFLFSSAKFGGMKAFRLSDADKYFFEQFNEPVTLCRS